MPRHDHHYKLTQLSHLSATLMLVTLVSSFLQIVFFFLPTVILATRIMALSPRLSLSMSTTIVIPTSVISAKRCNDHKKLLEDAWRMTSDSNNENLSDRSNRSWSRSDRPQYSEHRKHSSQTTNEKGKVLRTDKQSQMNHITYKHRSGLIMIWTRQKSMDIHLSRDDRVDQDIQSIHHITIHEESTSQLPVTYALHLTIPNIQHRIITIAFARCTS